MSWVLWFLGYPDQGSQKSREAIKLAQDLAHPYSLAFALNWAAAFREYHREGQAAQEQAEAAMTLSTEQGFAHTLWWGAFSQGQALVQQGRGEEGLARMREALAAVRATGQEAYGTGFLARVVKAYGRVGQVEEGLRVLREALALVDKTGERYSEAELYRLRGELTLQSKVPTSRPKVELEAEECFQKAIETARRQGARSLELRAATSCARLWQQQGKQKEAHTLLAEIYNWFTEGFDTKDLQEAKALMAALT